jgi:hypothetical protein
MATGWLRAISYRVILDVPFQLAVFASELLAEHRREIRTRAGTRALTCWKQAVFALAWFRPGDLAAEQTVVADPVWGLIEPRLPVVLGAAPGAPHSHMLVHLDRGLTFPGRRWMLVSKIAMGGPWRVVQLGRL